jgi:hypothetical protein
MREMMVKVKMTADDPRKKRFALSLPIIRIALTLADVGFQQRGIRAFAHNTQLIQPEHQLCQICFFTEDARATRQRPASIGEFAIVFPFKERTFRKTPLRGPENSVPLGRQPALDIIESSKVYKNHCWVAAEILAVRESGESQGATAGCSDSVSCEDDERVGPCLH